MFLYRTKRTLKLGIKSLWLHRLRSTLTALGIIFGVASVIAMLAIGEGASKDAMAQIARLGSLNIIVKTIQPPEDQHATGQQQRVAIARSLANDPLIILADEPTGNLDSQSGKDILNILDLLYQQGKTLIVITHDEDIAKHSQREIRLFDGQIDKQWYNR